jgi:hypothetical protein
MLAPAKEVAEAPQTLQDVLNLDEDPVVFRWKSGLSKASYDDLKSWIEL